MDWFLVAVLVLGVVSGATASVVGFGIGSLMTPLLALRFGPELAIAAVSLPHALGTAVRCFRLRRDIDRPVLAHFGLLSALGGLTGALLYARLGQPALTAILGTLLVLTSLANLRGWSDTWHPRGRMVPLLGLTSGLFGGLAGNQGGLRAAALSTFALAPAPFVATSTAIGLMVDLARMPVYLLRVGPTPESLRTPLVMAIAGVLAGTLLGERLLFGLSPIEFRRVLAAAVGVLGLWLIFRVVG